MALIFMDGFDAGDFIQKGWSAGGASTSTRFGVGRSLQNPGMLRFTASSQVFVGFAGLRNQYDSNFNGWFIAFYGDGGMTKHWMLNIDTSGFVVMRGSTVIASGALPQGFNVTQWNYYEISSTIDSVSGTIVIKTNGQTVINFTGNTRNGGTSTNIDAIAQGQYFTTSWYDDLYICNSTGSAPYNTFLGELKIQTLSPNAAGSSTQFTPSSGANYTTVNEMPYSAAQYVSSSVVGNRDLYNFADLSTVGTIHAVQNNFVAKRTDVGAISIKSAIKSGAAMSYGSIASTNTYDTTVMDTRTVDPNTSSSWTAAAVNSLEAVFEVA